MTSLQLIFRTYKLCSLQEMKGLFHVTTKFVGSKNPVSCNEVIHSFSRRRLPCQAFFDLCCVFLHFCIFLLFIQLLCKPACGRHRGHSAAPEPSPEGGRVHPELLPVWILGSRGEEPRQLPLHTRGVLRGERTQGFALTLHWAQRQALPKLKVGKEKLVTPGVLFWCKYTEMVTIHQRSWFSQNCAISV